jgi:S-adenosylmethionine decarboxylase
MRCVREKRLRLLLQWLRLRPVLLRRARLQLLERRPSSALTAGSRLRVSRNSVRNAERRSLNVTSGCEWIVEAHHCDAGSVSNPDILRGLFERLNLHPVGETQWHQFPGGGITGLALLQESHIACHTFPEHRSLCLNVFCCQPRPDWDFDACLRREFGAESVEVRRLDRPNSE